MPIFTKYPKVRSEIYFGTIGTCIKQTSNYAPADELKIITSLAYISHFYTITSINKQPIIITDLLVDMITSDFSQIKTQDKKFFLDHSITWDSIIDSFNDYEKMTVQRIFGFLTKPYQLIYAKNLPDSFFSLIGKKYGKYNYTVRIMPNKVVDSLSIWLSKIKLLLPMSVVMLAHYTYLSISEENRSLFKRTHLFLLEKINNRTLTYKEKHLILNQIILEFLVNSSTNNS